MRVVLIRVLLVFNPFLYIFVIKIKLTDSMIAVVLLIIIGYNSSKFFLFAIRVYLVIGILLWGIFFLLLFSRVGFSRRREYTSYIQWHKRSVFCRSFCLYFFEELIIFNSIIDRSGSKKCIKTAHIRYSIVFAENSVYYSFFYNRPIRVRRHISSKIVYLKAQYILVIYSISNGISV